MRRFGLVMMVCVGSLVSAACAVNDSAAVVEVSGQPDSGSALALENAAPEDDPANQSAAQEPADSLETPSTSTTPVTNYGNAISYFPDPGDDYELDADDVLLPDNIDDLLDRLIAPEDLAPLHPLLTSFGDSTIRVHPPVSLARNGGPAVDLGRTCGEVPEGLIGVAQRDLETAAGDIRIGHYVAVFESADDASAYGRGAEIGSDECGRDYGAESLYELTESRFQDERGGAVLYQFEYLLAEEGSAVRQAQNEYLSETLGTEQLTGLAFVQRVSVLLRVDGAALSSSQVIEIGRDSFTEDDVAAIIAAIDEVSAGSGQ